MGWQCSDRSICQCLAPTLLGLFPSAGIKNISVPYGGIFVTIR